MNTSPHHTAVARASVRRYGAHAALLGVLAPAPLLAHGAAAAGVALPAADFPEPFGAALLTLVVAGALGAVTADLVPGGTRLDRWKRGEHGWMLGALGKLIVGSASAVIVLTVNPPGGWAPLVGTALVAGLGGEALLVSVVSARRAHEAEKDRESLRAEIARRRAEGMAKLESVGALAIAANRDRRVRLERMRLAGAGALGEGPEAGTGEDPSFERLVHTAVERAKAELLVG